MEILYTQKDYQEKSELANSQGLKLYRYQHDVEYTEVVGDWNYETQTITYTDIDGNEVTEEIQVKTTPIMTTGTIVTIDENGNEIVYGAIGEILTEGYSIAVDPKVIPYRTEVLIDGNVYKAQDCGGAINGNEIDVYFSDHQSAKEFGVQYKDVYIIGG